VKIAYVDTSCLVAIAFAESGGTAMERRLQNLDEIVSANLLEAELRASFAREGADMDAGFLTRVSWVLPNRPLGPEIIRVLAVGHLRGANLWHVACAVYLAGDPSRISFLTLDRRQRDVAKTLGFVV
jgi:hypothetical protein